MYLSSHQRNSLARAKELVLLVLLLGCQPVIAQSNHDAETGKKPALPYQSVFGAYQFYQEQPVSSWREVNDEVEKIGGWRAYAREASANEGSTSEADQVKVKDRTEALPAEKTHSNLHGGSHE
ncbi:MAG: hypothetical protein WC236_09235 [Gallionellaceae bacterium]|jgi:hypothetical protein